MAKYDALRERALANFETLLDYWKVSYIKISEDEYDFINPTRRDENYGACRFNLSKGTGADFAGANFTDFDYKRLGNGFTKEDFAGLSRTIDGAWGFDVIGLCQRLHSDRCNNYKDGATLLRSHLANLGKSKITLNKPSPTAKEDREHKRQVGKLKALKSAQKTWNLCANFEGTIGDKYLRSRKIFIKDEPNIKFHEKIWNSELKMPIPALLFQVQVSPISPLVAIHRIYIAKDGSRKANLSNNKMALGLVKGAGIWFGQPNKQLCLSEGPENALSLRVLGYPFVVCTISAANFSNLTIPDYVEELILFPDPDIAGKNSAEKAIKAYGKLVKKIAIKYPPPKKLPNGKLADINDCLQGLGEPCDSEEK